MNDHSHRNHHGYHNEGGITRIKRLFRRHRRLAAVLLLALAVILGSLVWVISNYNEIDQISIIADNPQNVGIGYRNITYQGKNYRYNNRITAILFAGVDSDTPLVKTAKYTMAPRADSISLIVMDELHKKMTIVALSRDTMTKIRRYSMSGKKSGLYTDHLGYAYTYGDGGKASCDGLCEAVSLLLYGVPVSDFVITNRASIEIIGNIIGPVQITVPNNDLAEKNPLFTEGALVTIDAQNLEEFVRFRDTSIDFSNVGRMQRQQAYISSSINRVRSYLSEEPEKFWKQIQVAEDNVQTNITRSRYLELARIVKNTAFSSQNYYIPEGEQVAGEYHDEFYPDEASLLAKVVDIFYIEQ